MKKRSFFAAMPGIAAAFALLAAGCGNLSGGGSYSSGYYD
jgi:hypothetical protein